MVVGILSKLHPTLTWQQPGMPWPTVKGATCPSSLSLHSHLSAPLGLSSPSPSLHMVMAGLHLSTLCLCLSAFLYLHYTINSHPLP